MKDAIDNLNDKANDAIGCLNDAKYRLNRYADYQGYKEKLNQAYSLIINAFWEATEELDKQNKPKEECLYKGKHSSYLSTYETCDKCGYQG